MEGLVADVSDDVADEDSVGNSSRSSKTNGDVCTASAAASAMPTALGNAPNPK